MCNLKQTKKKRAVHVRANEKIKSSARPGAYADLLVIGWREWLGFPELGIKNIKAKIDTGARTSALHAFDIEPFVKKGKKYVAFKVHPFQKDWKSVTRCVAEMVDERSIKDSGGRSSMRPVISTRIKIGELSWMIEVTLINRDEMGFRMLIGREAIRGHLLVNPGNSFLLGLRVKDESEES
jgi:hypothetical protein